MSSVRVIYTKDDTKIDDDFCLLPKKLYDRRYLQQDESEERQLLAGTHPLSHYFTCIRFVVYKKKQPVARIMVFDYKKTYSNTYYFGYYECIDDDTVSGELFREVLSWCHQQRSHSRLVGPYNASFWVRYRLKLDTFNHVPYMGEPYSMSYYTRQFDRAGLTLMHTYVSNAYQMKYDRRVAAPFHDAQRRAMAHQYTIRSPKRSQKEQTLRQIYELFSELYSDFPGYETITAEEFLSLVGPMWPVLNLQFVKIAYDKQQHVAGFIVAFPDYGTMLFREKTPLILLRIWARRLWARRYVVMYVGVRPEHTGLGKALIRSVVLPAVLRGATIIGALALQEKTTANMAEPLIRERYMYGLYEAKWS